MKPTKTPNSLGDPGRNQTSAIQQAGWPPTREPGQICARIRRSAISACRSVQSEIMPCARALRHMQPGPCHITQEWICAHPRAHSRALCNTAQLQPHSPSTGKGPDNLKGIRTLLRDSIMKKMPKLLLPSSDRHQGAFRPAKRAKVWGSARQVATRQIVLQRKASKSLASVVEPHIGNQSIL